MLNIYIIKKRLNALVKFLKLMSLFIGSFVVAPMIFYYTSNYIVTVSGACILNDKDVVIHNKLGLSTFNDDQLALQTKDGVYRCSYNDVEIKTSLYKFSKLRDSVPAKKYNIVKNTDQLDKKVTELKKFKGKYVYYKGTCSSESPGKYFQLYSVYRRGDQVLMDLIDISDNTVSCTFNDDIKMRIVTPQKYVDSKIENNVSIKGYEVIFTAKTCQSGEEDIKSVYRLKGTIVTDNGAYYMISSPKTKSILKCLKSGVEELFVSSGE